MSYGRTLRQWAENLLLGTAGTTRTLAAGRFHLEAPDTATIGHPAHSCERAVRVTVRPGTPHVPVNTIDGQILRDHTLVVRVSYTITNAGGDAAETVTEESGPGTLEAVEDRAATDAADIEQVLMWHENATTSDPTVVNVTPPSAPALDVQDDRAVLELPYTLTVFATTTAAHAP